MHSSPTPSGKKTRDPSNERKPWSLWPILVSIIVFIVFYTWVQLNFRKAEPPNFPHEARQSKAVEKNLYDWYSLQTAQTPSDRAAKSAEIQTHERVKPLEQELPSQIVYYLPRRPLLAPRLEILEAEDAYIQGRPIRISLSLARPIGDSPLFNLSAFYKDGSLLLLAEIRVESKEELLNFDANGPAKPYTFEINSNPIDANVVSVELFCEQSVSRWSIHRSSP